MMEINTYITVWKYSRFIYNFMHFHDFRWLETLKNQIFARYFTFFFRKKCN